MNIRYMPNSTPMKIGKHSAQIYYVTHYVMWTFWSKIAFGLQTIHQFRFKMHLEHATLVFECLCQSTSISNSTRVHLCNNIYNRWRVEKLYWFHLFDITTPKTPEITHKSIFYGHNIRKQSGCLYLMKAQSETRPWSTGRGVSLMHTYEQGVLEWCLSGKVHIPGPHT